ncbi:hypothetical protein RHGRI_002769 [Rhododendron griersonianum]|uniref:Uncharacterized protein n=1 Tax=Rhododendron griersonianum TaxID=479676 RepID=A0AAV6LSD1_9ERIC|nr:hypothetical protein RHGRI_002769 [Rhododendron griersonianum]
MSKALNPDKSLLKPHSRASNPVSAWSRPPSGSIKINCNASWNAGSHSGFVGIVVCNHTGMLLDGRRVSISGPSALSCEGDSRSVQDAFFLGKALAEAVNERVESAEDVLERAKRAKEKAAREAMEAQSLTPKPSTAEVSVVSDVDTTTNSSSVTVAVTSAISPPSSSSSTPDVETKEDTNPTENDPLEGVSFHCLVQPVTLCSTLEMRFLEIFRISSLVAFIIDRSHLGFDLTSNDCWLDVTFAELL